MKPSCQDPRAADSVLRAIEFAERRIGADIGLAAMAEAACYSQFYFSRLFAQATGHAPYDYLMRRRVAVAAEELVEGGLSVVDIALRCGFGSPDSFARAFRRCFGLLPSEARRAGNFPRLIARTRIGREFVEQALGMPFGPPEDVRVQAAFLDAVPKGAAHVEVAQREGNLSPRQVFSGLVRSTGDKALPEYPSQATLLPGGRRARFLVGGGQGRLGLTLEYAYRTWFPLSGLSRLPDFDVVEWEGGRALSLSLALGE